MAEILDLVLARDKAQNADRAADQDEFLLRVMDELVRVADLARAGRLSSLAVISVDRDNVASSGFVAIDDAAIAPLVGALNLAIANIVDAWRQ